MLQKHKNVFLAQLIDYSTLMKTITLLLSLFLISSNAFAQDDDFTVPKVTFGLKAGLNSVQMKIASGSSDNVQKKSGVYAGAFVNIPTSDTFSIQPEVIYSSTEYLGRNNMNLLHIPVLLSFNLANNFTGFIGPEAQFLMGLGDTENKELFNDVLFGFTFGASYKITPNFYIDARPYFAFSKFLEEDSGYRKFNTLQIGVAYKF